MLSPSYQISGGNTASAPVKSLWTKNSRLIAELFGSANICFLLLHNPFLYLKIIVLFGELL